MCNFRTSINTLTDVVYVYIVMGRWPKAINSLEFLLLRVYHDFVEMLQRTQIKQILLHLKLTTRQRTQYSLYCAASLKGKEHKNINGFCLKVFGKLHILMQTA